MLNEIIRRKMIRESKPVQFKISFWNGNAYLKVFIWRSKGDMMAGAAVGGNFHACFYPSDYDSLRFFGELHFYKDFLGVGVVAHELLHAIFELSSRIRKRKVISLPKEYEKNTSYRSQYLEYLCQEMERLTKQFWKQYYKNEKKIKEL